MPSNMSKTSKLAPSDYRALAAFRYEIRRFLAFSEQAARAAGFEPQQHQLLLAVQGLPPDARPTIGTLAERLCVQHHTAVALVDKLEERGLIQRDRNEEDRREVLLRLTVGGETKLRSLSELHRNHLRSVGRGMIGALTAILGELEAPAAPPVAHAAATHAARTPTAKKRRHASR